MMAKQVEYRTRESFTLLKCIQCKHRCDHGGTFNLSSLGLDAFPHQHHSNTLFDANMGFAECAFSTTGAAVLSMILVNLLDILKVKLNYILRGIEPREFD
ncbi:uncharacterized protein LOC131231331 isoform X2 [Magnolia sinica]|uniref:uncharacterized protein LOC131231331 isoform X2 n=1 Tax=Magnolia sinica TaxID=86752 RepID=UPI002658A959|nr:uncharacterized protein LOC131231331 isoform X2 [Magnolia sinica]